MYCHFSYSAPFQRKILMTFLMKRLEFIRIRGVVHSLAILLFYAGFQKQNAKTLDLPGFGVV